MDQSDEYQLFLLFEDVSELALDGKFEEALQEATRGVSILREILHELPTEGRGQSLPSVQVQDV